ncbi:MAG: hypothetical protein H6741_13080 [Alphaproteobacteria bacterium]|nr:hypothetical protein [Alphaproteobacteria bacterium]
MTLPVRPLAALALSGLALSACSMEAQGEHLLLVGDALTSSPEELQSLLELGEGFHADIAALHPPGVVFDPEVRVELHGKFRQTSPYVDADGTVHLWRFSEGEGGYRAMYAHELVHGIGFDQALASGRTEMQGVGFYIEGWAEYVALLVDPEKTGFPLFGFDEDVVVGHWLEHGGLSLASLRTSHEALNMPCQYQGYILRASWYRYVDEVLGHKVLMDLVSAEAGYSDAAMAEVLGAELAQVDADWAAWALARYDAVQGADAEAQAYRERIYPVEPCVE